jgi:hypothetical protein
MSYVKEIFVIIVSSMIGAFLSQILTILANRRFSNPAYNLFYSNWIYLLTFGILILILAFVLHIKE